MNEEHDDLIVVQNDTVQLDCSLGHGAWIELHVLGFTDHEKWLVEASKGDKRDGKNSFIFFKLAFEVSLEGLAVDNAYLGSPSSSANSSVASD